MNRLLHYFYDKKAFIPDEFGNDMRMQCHGSKRFAVEVQPER